MDKKWLKHIGYIWLIAITLVVMNASAVYAHRNQAEHWKELEAMLFDDRNYRASIQGNENEKTALEILEYAEILSVDQFGETNKTLLLGLKKWKVKGIPNDVAELNPTEGETQLSARNHRNYTHQGWDYDYSQEKHGDLANWPIRKNLLLASTEKVFDFSALDGKFLMLDFGYSDKCNSFSALIYYIHVLGDYIEDDNVGKFNGMSNGHKIPFAVNTADPVDIFSELEKHIKILFADQAASSRTYSSLISDLETLAIKARRIAGSMDGQVTEENFDEIKQCVTELMDLLTGENKSGKEYPNTIHTMLMNEDFFKKVFYPHL